MRLRAACQLHGQRGWQTQWVKGKRRVDTALLVVCQLTPPSLQVCFFFKTLVLPEALTLCLSVQVLLKWLCAQAFNPWHIM